MSHDKKYSFVRVYKTTYSDSVSLKDIIGRLDFEHTDDGTIVHSLRVYDLYQRKGIGSYLLSFAERNSKLVKVYIHANKKNENFYLKRGYKYTYSWNGEHIRWEYNPFYIEMKKDITC